MSPPSSTQVRAKLVVRAPAERVFDAWTRPALARLWLFATPRGEVTEIALDPRVGGELRVVDVRDGVPFAHVGRFVELDRPRRLVFAFSVPSVAPDETVVAVDVRASGTRTEIELSIDDVRPEHVERATRGWSTLLARLASVIA